MKRFSLIPAVASVLIILTGCSSSPKQETKSPDTVPIDQISRARLFVGDDGIRAEVVELKGGEKALVKVTGTRSEVEGKVLEHEIQDDGRRLNYVTQVRGRDRYTLVRDSRRSGDKPTWRLYLGVKYRGGVAVSYDEKASQTLDAAAIYREHQEQREDGGLEALQRFDRKAEEKRVEGQIAETTERAKEKCGVDVSLAVAWDRIDDDELKKWSVSSYCGRPVEAMIRLCEKYDTAKAFVSKKVRKVECRMGSERAFSLAKGTLEWSDSWEGSNAADHAREQLLQQTYRGKTLSEEIALDETLVCGDAKKKRYIVQVPGIAEKPGLFYGDGKEFFRATTGELLGPDWFYDPRFYNPKRNASFRGYDLRSWSYAEFKPDSGTCELTCGSNEMKLELLPGKQARKVAESLDVKPPPTPYEPYALARDPRGVYYYVERSTTKGQERFFRLYVGRLGNVKPQKMKDIVSDSEGEIFSSKAGDLRLVLDKSKATWITGRKSRSLKRVPVEKNLHMIYNQLGVYTGVRLGTPCDDYGFE